MTAPDPGSYPGVMKEKYSTSWRLPQVMQEIRLRSLLKRTAAVAVLMAADLLFIWLAGELAVGLRKLVLPYLWPRFPLGIPPGSYQVLVWFAFLGLAVFLYEGLYTRRRSFWEECRLQVKGLTVAFLLTIGAVYLSKMSDATSRTLLVLVYLITLFILPAGRYFSKRFLAQSGLWKQRVLILGAGRTGEMVLEHLQRNSYLGYEVIGFLDDDPAKRNRLWRSGKNSVSVLGGFNDAARIMAFFGVRNVIVAAPGLPAHELVVLVNNLQRQAESVMAIPDFFGLPVAGIEVEYFFDAQTLALRVRNNLASPFNRWLKRTFDLTAGMIIALLTLPLMILIALAIKMDSPGPVIFAHKRLGQGGREFRCYKFRTMYLENEKILEEYLRSNPEARKEWEKYAKLKKYDPRVTRVGRFLRRSSLDELPQIFNVLKGEMSLVGPRPYLPRERNQMNGYAETILLIPPGITGLWQVSGRNEIDFAGRLNLEAWYVRNWSLWLDITLLIRTVAVVLARRGAY